MSFVAVPFDFFRKLLKPMAGWRRGHHHPKFFAARGTFVSLSNLPAGGQYRMQHKLAARAVKNPAFRGFLLAHDHGAQLLPSGGSPRRQGRPSVKRIADLKSALHHGRCPEPAMARRHSVAEAILGLSA
jgi:hypothetical protein